MLSLPDLPDERILLVIDLGELDYSDGEALKRVADTICRLNTRLTSFFLLTDLPKAVSHI